MFVVVIDHLCLNQWEFGYLQDRNNTEDCKDILRPYASQILFGFTAIIVNFLNLSSSIKKQLISKE